MVSFEGKTVPEIFEALRHDENFHLGMGDIRLTLDMQEQLEKRFNTMCEEFDKADEKLDEVLSQLYAANMALEGTE